MRKIKVLDGKLSLSDDVEVFYEKTVTKFGTSAKIDAPKKYIGKRAYIIILDKQDKIYKDVVDTIK